MFQNKKKLPPQNAAHLVSIGLQQVQYHSMASHDEDDGPTAVNRMNYPDYEKDEGKRQVKDYLKFRLHTRRAMTDTDHSPTPNRTF